MNPDSFAQSEFEGDGERLLDQLILDQESKLKITEIAISSFGLHAQQLELLVSGGPGSEALQISPDNKAYIKILIKQRQRIEEKLLELKAHKAKKAGGDKVQ